MEEQYIQPGMRLGRRAPDQDRLRRSIKFADVATGSVPDHPLVDDNFAKVKEWGLYANNRFGDCGPTSLANLYRLVTAYLGGGQKNISLSDVLDLYKRSGNPNFDPNTGADDNGVEMSVMLSAAVSGGIGGVKPLAFAQVDATNFEEMRAAIAIFGGVLWGSDLAQVQEQQFTNHQAWDYVASSPDWGGHATVTGKYLDSANDRQDRFTTVTWAAQQECTNAFVSHAVVEAWVVVWPENTGSTQFQQGINLNSLASDYQALTGQSFPTGSDPAPTPTAPPAPTPTTPPSSGGATTADQQLFNQMKSDINVWNAWAKSKGLE